VIYHLLDRATWDAARDGTIAVVPGPEGFVHCCDESQLPHVRSLYFSDDASLVALELDPTRLASETRYELGSGGELERFPHVYGPIEVSEVMRATAV
jgi:uncharacterized protein (DUF952 family)